MILKPELIRKYEYKWVIIGVKADFLSIEPTKRNEGLMISPVDNEVSFMSLAEITQNNSADILNYVNKNFEVNVLNTFLYLVKNKQIQVEFTERIVYHFLQIPNYIFTVQNYERESYNSGWLISSLMQMDDKLKSTYKVEVLNVKD